MLKDLYDRMPLILNPDDYDRWIDPGIADPSKIDDLLGPFEAPRMRFYRVSALVNRPENDGPECAKRLWKR